jgi:hypothetical protein
MIIKIPEKLYCLIESVDYGDKQLVMIPFYTFHILTTQIRDQITPFASVDDKFFNNLSRFKKNLFFKGTIELIPAIINKNKKNTIILSYNINLSSIIYYKPSGTINLLIKKKILKLFNDYGIILKVEDRKIITKGNIEFIIT